jgi:hypothetical protein
MDPLDALELRAVVLIAVSALGPIVGLAWTGSIVSRQSTIKEFFALTAFWAAVVLAWVWSVRTVAAIDAFMKPAVQDENPYASWEAEAVERRNAGHPRAVVALAAAGILTLVSQALAPSNVNLPCFYLGSLIQLAPLGYLRW